MAEKTKINRYESNVMSLPPLRTVLGNVPSPDPGVRRRPTDSMQSNREVETTVKKLIAHLKDNQK